jgi:hypothetical protein
MTHYAFTEEQEEFLESAAPARPSLWRYECERALVHARKNNELSVSREAIQNIRWYFKRGLINLPPERNLDQYCTAGPAVDKSTSAQTSFATVSRRGKDGKVQIDHLRFIGSDARAWLLVAYGNAEDIIRHADELLILCDDLLDPDFEFVLDPPEPTIDPQEAAITPLMKHFANMTERQVLSVFRVGSGVLRMRTTKLWMAACVLEAIRLGLGKQPARVCDVKVVYGTNSVQWRIRSLKGKVQNVMSENCRGANDKSIDGYDDLHSELDPVRKELELLRPHVSTGS